MCLHSLSLASDEILARPQFFVVRGWSILESHREGGDLKKMELCRGAFSQRKGLMVKQIAFFFIQVISIPFSHSIFVPLDWKLYLRDTFSIKTVKNLKVKILAKLRVNVLNHTNVPRIWHLLKMQIYLLSSASEEMGSWVRISLVQQLRNGFLFAISSFYLSQ